MVISYVVSVAGEDKSISMEVSLTRTRIFGMGYLMENTSYL